MRALAIHQPRERRPRADLRNPRLHVRRYRTAIADITKKMGAGMSRYAKMHAASGGKFSVDTLPSFDLYCHYVAGLVGEVADDDLRPLLREAAHGGEPDPGAPSRDDRDLALEPSGHGCRSFLSCVGADGAVSRRWR